MSDFPATPLCLDMRKKTAEAGDRKIHSPRSREVLSGHKTHAFTERRRSREITHPISPITRVVTVGVGSKVVHGRPRSQVKSGSMASSDTRTSRRDGVQSPIRRTGSVLCLTMHMSELNYCAGECFWREVVDLAAVPFAWKVAGQPLPANVKCCGRPLRDLVT